MVSLRLKNVSLINMQNNFLLALCFFKKEKVEVAKNFPNKSRLNLKKDIPMYYTYAVTENIHHFFGMQYTRLVSHLNTTNKPVTNKNLLSF